MASEDVHKSMARLLLGHAQNEYRALEDSWKSIEQKAQGTVAIVGIFMATATTAIFKIDLLDHGARVVLFFAVVLLVAAALIAIATLFVRSFATLEGLEYVVGWAKDVYGATDDGPDRVAIREFVEHRIKGWKRANSALHKEIERKARLLQWAQYLLFAGIVLLAIVCGSVIAPC